jgi:hypothetical protein
MSRCMAATILSLLAAAPAGAQSLRYGPIVQDVREGRLTLVVGLDAPGDVAVEYGPTEDYGS